MMIGAAAGLIFFGVFGLLPSFRFGSYLALFILHKTSGKPVEAAAGGRAFILAVALFCVACAAILSLVLGALLGSFVLR